MTGPDEDEGRTAEPPEPGASVGLRWRTSLSKAHIELAATGEPLCGGRNMLGVVLGVRGAPPAQVEGEEPADEKVQPLGGPRFTSSTPAYTKAEIDGVERAMRQARTRDACMGCCLAVVILGGMGAALEAIEHAPKL